MVDGQLRVRGTQGWTSLTKKATGEPLLRGIEASEMAVASASLGGSAVIAEGQEVEEALDEDESMTSHAGGDPAFSTPAAG
eukprot:COSAG01_NODE_72496_length_252_cov_36.660131_1_plen_80_part_10